jgi:hypothetical protein
MNKLLIVSLILLAGGSALAQSPTYKDFLGMWRGVDEERHSGSLNFLDSSQIMISMMGGTPIRMFYRLDLSSTPSKLYIYRDPARKGAALPSLVQLFDPATLKWQVFPGQARAPAHFQDSSTNTLIVLKKVN